MGMGSYSNYKKRNRGRPTVPFERIENLRKEVKFTIIQISELLEFTTRQYARCRQKGAVDAFRYYAVKQALISLCLTECQERLMQISNL